VAENSTAARLLIVACLALAVACEEGDDNDDCPCDAGVDGDADTDTDADADTDTDTDGVDCTETFESFEGIVEHAGALVEAETVLIKAYEGTQGQGCGYGAVTAMYLRDATAGDYDLAPTTNIHDCDKCIVLGANCSIPDPSSCVVFFLATEGHLDLVSIVEDEPWGNHFEFVAENLVLVEHTIDWESGVAEPVAYGETMCIDSWQMATELIDWN